MNKYYDDYSILSLDTEIKEEKEDWYAFEETIFYGEKGGMLSDKGTINGLDVLDLKYEDDVLYHKVDGVLNNPIHMEVDASNRRLNTVVQSVLHILDGYFAKTDNYIPSVGVNPDNQWFEVNIKDMDDKQLHKTENYMKQVIQNDIKLSVSYINGKDYPDTRYQNFDSLRIVSFGDLDSQPCGTLHINSTKEIGDFVILNKERTSRGTKIYFACGEAIGLKLKKDTDILNGLSKILSCRTDDINDKAKDLFENNRKLKKENADLNNELITYKARDLIESPSVTEVKCKEQSELRNLANALSSMIEDDRILYSYIEDTLNIAVLSKNGNARNIFKKLQEDFNIQGGGSPKMALGKYTGEDNISEKLRLYL